MRISSRIIVVALLILGSTIIAVFCWFRFYTRDLPDVEALANFAPQAPMSVFDPCRRTTSTAIPYDAIGSNFRAALNAVGVRETDAGDATLARRISLTTFGTRSKMLRRHIDELRMTQRLERRFSSRELFTIYANRVYFGENVFGVQEAAEHFFSAKASDLTIAQAALLAGLIRSPSLYSPVSHPDRALQRRNELIDAMVTRGSITQVEADRAKLEQLEVAAPSAR